MKRKTRINYTVLALFEQFEFGCIHNHIHDEYAYEVIIIDHHNCLIRTLGLTDELKETKKIATKYIREGFNRHNIQFEARPDYMPVATSDVHSA